MNDNLFHSSPNVLQQHKRASKKLAIEIIYIGEQRIQLSTLLEDSTNLREDFVWYITLQNLK